MKSYKNTLNHISIIAIPLLLIAYLAIGYQLIQKKTRHNSDIDLSTSTVSDDAISSPSEENIVSSEIETSIPEPVVSPDVTVSSEVISNSEPLNSVPAEPTVISIPDGYFDGSLFIGDSRTEGLRLYGHMSGAVFFSNKGMSINSVQKEAISVEGIGTVNLTDLLSAKNFDKIYIMLGINEIGNKLEINANKFSSLISEIQAIQPETKIIIEANLHVSSEKSTVPGTVFNNPRIDEYNRMLSSLANGQSIFYIDPNSLFDDSNGNLRSECTNDGVHIFAKHYTTWASWLMQN